MPLSASKNSSALKVLELSHEDLNRSQNLLLLASNIEFSFDRLKVSYVPSVDENFFEVFVLKIWDSSITTMQIFDGSPKTIGDYVNHSLKLRHRVFKRYLAYQSMWACAKHLSGIADG